MEDIRIKSCSKCGKEFECRPKSGCWCEEIKLSAEALKELKEKFADCLCKGCLEGFSKK